MKLMASLKLFISAKILSVYGFLKQEMMEIGLLKRLLE